MKLITMSVKDYAALLRAIDALENGCDESNPKYQKGLRSDIETLKGIIRRFDKIKVQIDAG